MEVFEKAKGVNETGVAVVIAERENIESIYFGGRKSFWKVYSLKVFWCLPGFLLQMFFYEIGIICDFKMFTSIIEVYKT